MNRDSTIFYRSFYEAIKELPEANQLEIYNAIFEHSLNLNKPNLTGLSKTIYTLIEPQIEANLKRFLNGKEPKKKRSESEKEARPKRKRSKTEANNNNNNNVNINDNLVIKSDLFEKFWLVYNKGSRKASRERFMKLTIEEIEQIRKHLVIYFAANPEIKYRKDAERYLSNRLWENNNDDTLKAMNGLVVLPDKWWSADLTLDQQKLLTPEQLKNWKQNRTRQSIGA